jgi:hypothetical protein
VEGEVAMTDIGKTKRTIIVEPIEDPKWVPAKELVEPVQPKQPVPEREREDVPA